MKAFFSSCHGTKEGRVQKVFGNPLGGILTAQGKENSGGPQGRAHRWLNGKGKEETAVKRGRPAREGRGDQKSEVGRNQLSVVGIKEGGLNHKQKRRSGG